MPKTLLVVDESKTIREAARLALAGEDWDVAEASNPSEALLELATRSTDAVLCDSGLAGDGYTFCREIRNTPQARDIPILLMGSRVDQAAANAAGASQTLPKPFAADELSEALHAAVELQGLSRELAESSLALNETPLTLDELSGPFHLGEEPPAGVPPDAPVEIIDLSGDEDFEDLELLEDLEPIPVEPSLDAQEQALEQLEEAVRAAAEPVASTRSAPGDNLDFALADLASDWSEPAIDVAGLEPTEGQEVVPTAQEDLTTAVSTIEIPADLGFGLRSPGRSAPTTEEWPAPSAPAVEEALIETPYSYEPPEPSSQLEPQDAQNAATPIAESPTPADTSETVAALSASIENAVREALAQSLSPETMIPLVEQIVERVVWEVVPQLAERLIVEAIEKLKTAPPE